MADILQSSIENRLVNLNAKFQKEKENYGPKPNQIILSHR